MTSVERITVATDAAYDVVVGHSIAEQAADLVGERAQRIAVIRPDTLRSHALPVVAALRASGRTVLELDVPDAEAAKTASVAAHLWESLGHAGFTRTDVIVSVGGGATTDLAGFVAGTWLRGVPVVHVPTTLLAMVDAAVGGKTGINTTSGKNLVGVIHEPRGVVCDLDALRTLPTADLAAGLAEVIKAGFIRDTSILADVESDPASALTWDSELLLSVVTRAIRVKAQVVADDLRESIDRPLGREVLNYGHTFGHAIEQVESYAWRHGDAVSVGMVFVAELAHRAGRLDAAGVARHRHLLGSVGLPVSYPDGRWPELLSAMRVDKKARGDRMRFIVLDDIGVPGLLEGPDPGILESAYHEVAKGHR